MTVIQAYVDDSGNSADCGKNPVFVLAGYIASADLWAAFSAAWEAECAKAPSIADFKMSQANGLSGDFGGWTRAAADARCLELAKIIQAHTVVRIHTAIVWEDYERIVRGRVPGVPDDPYFWLFYNLIHQVADWQVGHGLRGNVDFIFDDQGKIGAQSAGWYETLREIFPPTLQACLGSTPIFRHDKDVLPLKAADMWAWHVRRYIWRGIGALGRNEQPETPPLMQALMTAPPVGELIDLEALVEGYRAGVEDAQRGVTHLWERSSAE
jgi:hypothetical protein